MVDKDAFGSGCNASDETRNAAETEIVERALDADLKAELAFLEPVMVLNGDVAQASVSRDTGTVAKLAHERLEIRRARANLDFRTSKKVSLYAGAMTAVMIATCLLCFDRSTHGDLVGLAAVLICIPLGVSLGFAASTSAYKQRFDEMNVEQEMTYLKWERPAGTSREVLVLLLGREGIAFRLNGRAFYTRLSSVRSVSVDMRPSLKAPILNLSLDLSHLPGYSPILDLAVYAPKSSAGETEAAIANHIATMVATAAADR